MQNTGFTKLSGLESNSGRIIAYRSKSQDITKVTLSGANMGSKNFSEMKFDQDNVVTGTVLVFKKNCKSNIKRGYTQPHYDSLLYR
jgi:hypothetical protein